MALLTGVVGAPPAQPLLGWLVAGFVLLVIGLAALTLRRPRIPIHSPAGTRRALLYVVVYAMCSSSFMHVIGSALLGRERSPWLLALGDVMFVTLGLFAWVMMLAEDHQLEDYGLQLRVRPSRLVIPMLMGLGAVALYALEPYRALVVHRTEVTADSLVFSSLFATLGSAIPDEVLFRGFLMSSLEGRASRWARVATPALVFTAVRALRFMPGSGGLGVHEWLLYIFGAALPLGLWWGLMRELAGGSLWPSLISHALLEFGIAIAGMSPVTL